MEQQISIFYFRYINTSNTLMRMLMSRETALLKLRIVKKKKQFYKKEKKTKNRDRDKKKRLEANVLAISSLIKQDTD